MSFNLTVTGITFSDGSTVTVPPRGVIAFVGPNNVGKSVALREIPAILEEAKTGKVIHDVQYSHSGTINDLTEWLDQNCAPLNEKGSVYYHRGTRRIGWFYATRQVEACLTNRAKGLGDAAQLLCVVLDATERLAASLSSPAHDPKRERPKLPIQELLDHESLELELRAEARSSFGAEFIIGRSPGKNIYVYWGEEPKRDASSDRASTQYVHQLSQLPLLDEQGDGLRSFLGTLFYLKLAREFVVLIDEPEAFLHPPQERRLGALIGRFAQERQIFVATHSSDLLRGLMDEHPETLKIIHVRRVGDANVPKVLESAELINTWADPMVRYSNILDGLFHDLVVLCESEVDCRFYHAVFDYLWKTRAPSNRPQPTILFADVGGKTAFARATAAITAFGIPVRVIADFDILNSDETLSKLCSSIGASWGQFEKNWRQVRNAVEKKGSAPQKIEEVRKQFNELCSGGAQRLDQTLSKRLSELVHYPSAWADAKRIGTSFIPSGEESVALEQLLKSLKGVGIHVVPVGEVE
jgi:energy-coupling factor transporter ATP-binding protein EcfA2